jgi:hypothetical protein
LHHAHGCSAEEKNVTNELDFNKTLVTVREFQGTLDRNYRRFKKESQILKDNPDAPDDLFLNPGITLVVPEDVVGSLNSSMTINWNKGDPLPEDMPDSGVVYGYNYKGTAFVAASWWKSALGWRTILYMAPHGGPQLKSEAVYAPFHGMPYIMEFLKLAKNPEFGFQEEVLEGIHFFRYSLPKNVTQNDLEKLPEFHLSPRSLPRYVHEIRKKRGVPRAMQDSTWWIADDLSTVVWDTVLTDTAPADVLEEDLPGPYGIMYFDGGTGLPLPCVPFYGPDSGTVQFLTINAVIWDQNFDRNELLIEKRPNRTNFTPICAANGSFLNYPDSSGGTFPLMTDGIGSPDWSIEHVLGFSRRTIGDLSEKLVKTALRLSRMDYFATNTPTFIEPATKSDRKKAKREGKAPDTIVVATLRRPRNQTHEDLVDSEGREFSHRWIVRGHNRKQLIGRRDNEERVYKNVWIAPYVKGPWDKPLVIKDKVNVWKR